MSNLSVLRNSSNTSVEYSPKSLLSFSSYKFISQFWKKLKSVVLSWEVEEGVCVCFLTQKTKMNTECVRDTVIKVAGSSCWNISPRSWSRRMNGVWKKAQKESWHVLPLSSSPAWPCSWNVTWRPDTSTEDVAFTWHFAGHSPLMTREIGEFLSCLPRVSTQGNAPSKHF